VGLVVALVLFGGGSARAAPSLQKDFARIARDLKALLTERGESALTIGQFKPVNKRATGGPGIAHLLAVELRKLKVSVKAGANVRVKGEFEPMEDEDTGQLYAELTITVQDRAGKPLLKDERRLAIANETDLAAFLGLTVDLPPKDKPLDRGRRLRKVVEKPQVHLDGAQVEAGDSSPYALEILVSDNPKGPFRPRKPTSRKGQAFVEIKRDEYYQVRLINNSAHEAAVRLTIDGINMFAFSQVVNDQGLPKYSLVIVPPKKASLIPGWHVTNKESDAFVVTSYAKSAAAELRSTAKMGTLTATFAAAWPRDSKPPADEPAKPSDKSLGSQNGTGRGPRVGKKYVEVQRQVGVVRATISVRYTK
jgi:hypothetical protein